MWLPALIAGVLAFTATNFVMAFVVGLVFYPALLTSLPWHLTLTINYISIVAGILVALRAFVGMSKDPTFKQ